MDRQTTLPEFIEKEVVVSQEIYSYDKNLSDKRLEKFNEYLINNKCGFIINGGEVRNYSPDFVRENYLQLTKSGQINNDGMLWDLMKNKEICPIEVKTSTKSVFPLIHEKEYTIQYHLNKYYLAIFFERKEDFNIYKIYLLKKGKNLVRNHCNHDYYKQRSNTDKLFDINVEINGNQISNLSDIYNFIKENEN
jgi:hypothetical protein